MILGLGTDIVENGRIAAAYRKRGERFLSRVYTPEEIEYSLSHADPIPYLAARFAVKEAAIKALNIAGASAISLKDVETSGRIFGKKKLALQGRAREIADSMGVRRLHLSMSHTKSMSMAAVILED